MKCPICEKDRDFSVPDWLRELKIPYSFHHNPRGGELDFVNGPHVQIGMQCGSCDKSRIGEAFRQFNAQANQQGTQSD